MNEYNKSPQDDQREKSNPETPPTPPGQAEGQSPIPPVASVPGNLSASEIQSKKLAAGLLGILLGALGIHKFYLG